MRSESYITLMRAATIVCTAACATLAIDTSLLEGVGENTSGIFLATSCFVSMIVVTWFLPLWDQGALRWIGGALATTFVSAGLTFVILCQAQSFFDGNFLTHFGHMPMVFVSSALIIAVSIASNPVTLCIWLIYGFVVGRIATHAKRLQTIEQREEHQLERERTRAAKRDAFMAENEVTSHQPSDMHEVTH